MFTYLGLITAEMKRFQAYGIMQYFVVIIFSVSRYKSCLSLFFDRMRTRRYLDNQRRDFREKDIQIFLWPLYSDYFCRIVVPPSLLREIR